MATLGRSKAVYEMIDGNPTSRDEFVDIARSLARLG
jgi:4-oxalocrotonate tautomerase